MSYEFLHMGLKKNALMYIQFCRQFSGGIEHELTRAVNK